MPKRSNAQRRGKAGGSQRGESSQPLRQLLGDAITQLPLNVRAIAADYIMGVASHKALNKPVARQRKAFLRAATGEQVASIAAALVVFDQGCTNPQAVTVAGSLIGWMLQNAPATALKLVETGLRVIIVSVDAPITEATDRRPTRSEPSDTRVVQAPQRKQIIVGEERLVHCLPSTAPYLPGRSLVHALAQTVSDLLSRNEFRHVRSMYERAKSNKLLPSANAGASVHEYWAEVTQAWFNMLRLHVGEHAWVARTLRSSDRKLLRRYYGAPPASVWEHATPRNADWSVIFRTAKRFSDPGMKPIGAMAYTRDQAPVILYRQPLALGEHGEWQVIYRKAAEHPGRGWKPIGAAPYMEDEQPVIIYRKAVTQSAEDANVFWRINYLDSSARPNPGWKPIGVTSYTWHNRPVILYRKRWPPKAGDAQTIWRTRVLPIRQVPRPGWQPVSATSQLEAGEPVILYRKRAQQSAADAALQWYVQLRVGDSEPNEPGWKPIGTSPASLPTAMGPRPEILYRKAYRLPHPSAHVTSVAA